MSQFKAEVVRIDVVPHPNADRLEIAKIRNKMWQCIIAKDSFKSGDLAVYIPIESVLPEPLVKALGIEKNYHSRLRSIKLRGELSQGMVMKLPPDPSLGVLEEGRDLTDFLGIKKWEEPIPVQMAGQLRAEPGDFYRYTDIENWKNYPDVFYPGQPVIISEKVHGSNFRTANINGEIHVGSHRRNIKEDPNNLYWRAAEMLKVKEILYPGEQIFAEVYGSGIQDLTYGKRAGEFSIVVFDFMRGGKYVNYKELINLSWGRGFSLAPHIKNFDGSLIHKWDSTIPALAEGNSLIAPNQMKEGIVVRPAEEMYSDKLKGRMILKIISDTYLSRKNGTEGH